MSNSFVRCAYSGALLVVACCFLSIAADGCLDSSGLVTQVGRDIGVSVTDACALAQSPAHWTGGSFLLAALAVGATGGAFALDNDVRRFRLDHTSTQANRIILPWQNYGNGFFAIGGAGVLYCGGLAFSNDWLRETGRSALTALALTGVATSVIKITAGRARPYVNEGPRHFAFFQFADDSWSFPSGHTATAFALSSVLAARIDNIYVSIPLYGIAAMTATARVYGDQHWFSDAVVGAIIGTAIGHFAGSRSREARKPGTCHVDIEPITVGTQSFGLAARLTY